MARTSKKGGFTPRRDYERNCDRFGPNQLEKAILAWASEKFDPDYAEKLRKLIVANDWHPKWYEWQSFCRWLLSRADIQKEPENEAGT